MTDAQRAAWETYTRVSQHEGRSGFVAFMAALETYDMEVRMPRPDINEIREAVTTICNGSTNMAMVMPLAIIYLGDSIREANGDIGPAIAKAGEHIAVNVGGIQQGLNDLGSEVASMGGQS